MMTLSQDNKRIDYFDLMKGVCIVLVIISHCCVELKVNISGDRINSMLESLRMPLYFFLSGMFFKEYSSFVDFVIRKFNKLIIPLLFFSVITVIPKLIVNEIPCELIAIRRYITWMLKFGGYLWFLRTLFFSNIIYYIYNRCVQRLNLYIRLLLLFVFVGIGWGVDAIMPLGECRLDNSNFVSIVAALMVLPFFYVASALREYLTNVTISARSILLVFIISLLNCFLFSNGIVDLKNAYIDNNMLGFYVSSFSAIALCWSGCVVIKKMFYLSFVGRYSIIAYLTHYPIINVIIYMYPHINILYLISAVLLLMPLMIWMFKTIFPVFVAQRDIFVSENNKIKVDWSAFSLKKR